MNVYGIDHPWVHMSDVNSTVELIANSTDGQINFTRDDSVFEELYVEGLFGINVEVDVKTRNGFLELEFDEGDLVIGRYVVFLLMSDFRQFCEFFERSRYCC